jgi:hypothetical protein
MGVSTDLLNWVRSGVEMASEVLVDRLVQEPVKVPGK